MSYLNLSAVIFRLVWYETPAEDKFEAEHRYEFLADRFAIFRLWFMLTRAGNKHVEIYSLDGRLQEPEKGISGLSELAI